MTYIIAEAGVNHNGDITLAEKLIKVASDAGADAIKFQAWKAENLVTNNAPLAIYQKQNTKGFSNQYEMLKQLELNEEDHIYLKSKCKAMNIEYLSSAFDLEGIEMLNRLGLKKLKIPSGEITNLPFLKKAGYFDWDIILSTGMSDLKEIKDALYWLEHSGKKRTNISVLQCTTQYPAPFDSINLSAMKTISDAFNVKIGYSDHTIGITAPIAAVALGALIIEKHITLDRNLTGPDHKASLEPSELKLMVKGIRNTEAAIGNGLKIPNECEIANKAIARKSIVAKQNISKNDIFTEDNICTKRPGNGLSAMNWNEVIGKKSKKNYKTDDLID
tara:strand:+ start:10 stop:1005 length:996 start_codon:yes stop_codon:yes gene_type:complete